MPGVRIAHRKLRSCVALVPLMHKPFTGGSLDRCPTCQVVHPVKTVHLWLDDAGACIVSEGVLADLKRAGMPGLEIMATVKKPPPLRFGPGHGNPIREQLDSNNRKIRLWTRSK